MRTTVWQGVQIFIQILLKGYHSFKNRLGSEYLILL